MARIRTFFPDRLRGMSGGGTGSGNQGFCANFGLHLTKPNELGTFGVGYKLGLAPTEGFLRFKLDTIPPRSRIKAARFLLTASATKASPSNFFIALLRRDGFWDINLTPIDLVSNTLSPARSVDGDLERIRVLARDGLSTLADSGTAGTSAFRTISIAAFSVANGNIPMNRSLAQVLQATSSATCDNVVFRIQKVGSPSGVIYAAIYGVNQTTFQPTGLLGLSDEQLASSIATSITDVPFTFSGANMVSLVSGQYYTFVITTRGNNYDTSNYYRVYSTDANDGDVNERVFLVSTRGGFGPGSYPNHLQFPFLYQSASTTIHTQPFGTIIQKTMPAHASGSVVTITGIEGILQEWIDSPNFITADRAVGFVFSTKNEVWSDLATFPTVQLLVEFEPRRVGIS